MTLIHIVLVKLNPETKSGKTFDSFKAACDSLSEKPELKPFIKEMIWKKPEYTTRNRDYDWGLYSVFENKEEYEKYSAHPEHRSFVSDWINKYSTDLLAYDWEM